MTGIDNPLEKTKILPVKPYNELLSRQYFSASHLWHHKKLWRCPTKTSFFQKNKAGHPPLCYCILQFIPTIKDQELLKAIIGMKNGFTLKKVRREPFVVGHTMTILVQLRSGWSFILNSNRESIIPCTINRCPRCY